MYTVNSPGLFPALIVAQIHVGIDLKASKPLILKRLSNNLIEASEIAWSA